MNVTDIANTVKWGCSFWLPAAFEKIPSRTKVEYFATELEAEDFARYVAADIMAMPIVFKVSTKE